MAEKLASAEERIWELEAEIWKLSQKNTASRDLVTTQLDDHEWGPFLLFGDAELT